MTISKKIITNFLKKADIKINGTRSWDIQVHNPDFYKRVLKGGTLGLGESYMEKWWDCERLDLFFEKLLRFNTHDFPSLKIFFMHLKTIIFNLQTKSRSKIVGEKHYDVGNDLYKAMLDKRMVYTCGYYKDAKNLDEAQEAKLDLVCKKVGLKKGMKILDIGCGWGSFAKYAAEKYEVEVVGITISKEQVKLAKELCKDLPIEIRLQDYREIDEKFDAIVSIGMLEAVGYKNYRTFMKKVYSLLKDEGLCLIHTIGVNKSLTIGNAWIDKYIFSNGIVPSLKQITKATENCLVLEDFHNFGLYYPKTLLAWEKNFRKNYSSLSKKYDEKFYRMWEYYLLTSVGVFQSRYMHLWQFVFSKGKLNEVYTSVR